MLDDSEVERIFCELALPDAARQLVRRTRLESPVREPRSNLGNVVTWLFSKKMGNKHLRLESRTVETSAATLYENESAILEYWPQPVKIDLAIRDRNGTVKGRTPHTPDFMLVKSTGIVFTEWREESRLIRASEDSDQFYKDEDSRWHYRAAEDFFAMLGLEYELHSAVELPRTLISNVRFLEDYNLPTCPELTAEVTERLVHAVRERGTVSFMELRDKYGCNADAIFTAVARQVIYVDLQSERLHATEDLAIHRDASVARAYQYLQIQQEHPPLPYPGMRRIAPGTNIKFNNQDYVVALVGTRDVLLRNRCGEAFTLPIDDVIILCASSLDVEGGEVAFQPKKNLADFSESQLSNALKRLDAVLKNDQTIPKRTRQRWKAKVGNPLSNLDAVIALVDRNPDKGNHAARIPPESEALANECIRSYYNTPTAPTKSATFLKYKVACEEHGVIPMSFPTFCKRVDENISIKNRHGKRKEYQTSAIPLYLDYREPIHGVRPHEVCYVDHTTLNLATTDIDGADLRKPIFSTAIDGNTTQARAFYVSYDPASARVVLMVLRDYVRRHHRLPKILVVDGGPEFRSKELELFCKLYGIDARFRPKCQPRHGSPVERAMGYTETEFLAQLEGNTRVLKEARIATKNVEPFQYRRWTLSALWRGLEEFLFSIRADRPHPALGVSPNEFEQIRIDETGIREHVVVRFDSNLLLLTSPHPKVHRHCVDPTRGVWVDSQYYWHDDFRAANPGEKFEVRVEMWNANVIYVYFRTRWVAAIGRDLRRFDGRTRYEVELAVRDWRRKAKANSNSARLGKVNAKKVMVLLSPENFDPRIYKQQKEMRLLYENLGMAYAMPAQVIAKTDTNFPQLSYDTSRTINPATNEESGQESVQFGPPPAPSIDDVTDSDFWRNANDFI